MNRSLTLQRTFPGLCPVTDAVERLAASGGIEERGAVYTRSEVVDFILDLVGYTIDQPLQHFRLMEPSFGDGDFLLPVLDRLLTAAKRANAGLSANVLGPAIRGVELHRQTFEKTRETLLATLLKHGIEPGEAARLLQMWLVQGDYLLEGFDHRFTHVVGNPPYVRQESVPDVLMSEYRQRFQTIYDRADIYVPFFEHSLTFLESGGKLGFICADRWMKNKYGKKLRELVSRNFSLTAYIDMVGTDAFLTEVSAYPAITIIERSKNPLTRVYARPVIESAFLQKLAADITLPSLPAKSPVREIQRVALNEEPWVLDSFEPTYPR